MANILLPVFIHNVIFFVFKRCEVSIHENPRLTIVVKKKIHILLANIHLLLNVGIFYMQIAMSFSGLHSLCV